MAMVTRAPGVLFLPAWDVRRQCPEEDEAEGLDSGSRLGQLKGDTHREASGRFRVPSALVEVLGSTDQCLSPIGD